MKTITSLLAACLVFHADRSILGDTCSTQPNEAVRLLSVVSDAKRTYNDREASIAMLAKLPASDVLPPLAEIIDAPERKSPLGLSAQHDALDPQCQVTQELERVWNEQCDPQAIATSQGASSTLVKLLNGRANLKTTVRIINSIASGDILLMQPNADPGKETALLARFHDGALPVRLAAACALACYGKKHEPEILDVASRSSYPVKGPLVEIAIGALENENEFAKFADALEPRTSRVGRSSFVSDPLLTKIAYQLIDEEVGQKEPAEAWNPFGSSYASRPYPSGDDAAVRFGRAVSVDFRPQMDAVSDTVKMSDYQLPTVKNARDWWAKHGSELTTQQSSAEGEK